MVVTGGIKNLKILLNHRTLDFTLENEKNLGDIITGVESWLKNSDLVITSVKILEKELLSDVTEEWKNTLIENIDQLSLIVKPMNELHLSSMQNIAHFLKMLKQAFSAKDTSLLKELNEGYPFMIESLTLLSQRLRSESLSNHTMVFTNHFPNINKQMVFAWTKEEQEVAVAKIDSLLNNLIEIIEEMNNPFKTIQKLARKIKISSQDISEVSILLQTGKDREAMNILVAFSDTLQKFLRIFLILKENKNIDINHLTILDMSFEKYYNELNGFLKELIDAFQINDSVLIGDLLEYEIAPRLEGLIQFIERLKALDRKSEKEKET